MAVILRQTKSTAKTTGSVTSASTWSSNTLNGSFVVLLIYTDSLTADTVSSVTDSQSNTYNKIFSTTCNGVNYCTVDVWVAYNITGGTTPTVTATHPASQISGMIHREYIGIPPTAVVDKYVSTPFTTATSRPVSAATDMTTNQYELSIAVVADNDGGNTFSSGYGKPTTSLDIGTTGGCAMYDRTLIGVQAENAIFNTTPNTSVGVVGMITIPAIKDNIITSRLRPNPFAPGLAR